MFNLLWLAAWFVAVVSIFALLALITAKWRLNAVVVAIVFSSICYAAQRVASQHIPYHVAAAGVSVALVTFFAVYLRALLRSDAKPLPAQLHVADFQGVGGGFQGFDGDGSEGGRNV